MDINKDLALKLVKELVAKGSARPKESESGVAQFIYDYLSSIKLNPQKIHYDKDRFSVIVVGKNNPKLLINGHMDTVSIGERSNWTYDPCGELADNKFYGRGSADTKGQIAMVLAAMSASYNDGIVYIFNVEEEMSLGGIKAALDYLNEKDVRVKYSISLEPTDGKLVIGNKGSYRYEVFAKGKSAHSSQPQDGDNAIYKTAHAALNIEKYNNEIASIKHPLFDHASVAVCMLESGTATNVIPDRALMLVDRRTLPNENPNEIDKRFRDVVAPLDVSLPYRIEACETPQNSFIVTSMQDVLANSKMDSNLYGFGATSELSEIRKHGIEGIIFGTAQLDQAHKSNEYITLEQLNTGTSIFERFLKKWK